MPNRVGRECGYETREKLSRLIDMALALQGTVPGLVVTNSGRFGFCSKIASPLARKLFSSDRDNATNEPLYVMDGQIISSRDIL